MIGIMPSKLAVYELSDGRPAKCIFEDTDDPDKVAGISDEVFPAAFIAASETPRDPPGRDPTTGRREEFPRPRSEQEPKETIPQQIFQQFLESYSRAKSPEGHAFRRIFLLEGTHTTAPSLDDLTPLETADEPCSNSCKVCLLKQYLGVPESLFREHKKQSVSFSFNEDVRFPRLPTRRKPDQTFQLHYFDLREFTGDPASITFQCPLTQRHLCPGSDGAFTLTCAETGREIQCHEWQNRFDPDGKRRGTLFIVPRKCSFWIKKYKNGGFDAIIIVDPQISEASVGPFKLCLTQNKAFDSHDHFDEYLPSELAWNPSSSTFQDGPPRDGIFKDLRYCFENFSHNLDLQDGSLAAPMFLKKIIACHYIPLIAFVSHQITSMRSRGWALQRDTDQQREEARLVETDWSRFRCSEYLEAMMENLFALAIPRASTDVLAIDDWKATAEEFQWIYQSLFECRSAYHDLTDSMAALAGIVSNDRTAIGTTIVSKETSMLSQDARATKIVTFVALVFAPLALIASFFSMGPIYGPGGPRFGVYFAVSLPLTALVLCVSLISIEGFADNFKWSNTLSSILCGARKIMSSKEAVPSLVDDPADVELSIQQTQSRPTSVVNGSIHKSSMANNTLNPHIVRPTTHIPLQTLRPLDSTHQYSSRNRSSSQTEK